MSIYLVTRQAKLNPQRGLLLFDKDTCPFSNSFAKKKNNNWADETRGYKISLLQGSLKRLI